ncbi:MAG: metallophosphoesterase family protein [Sphingomicrobium sp.]
MVFFRSRSVHAPAGPRGHRGYVVGDVHGRLDLLDHLLATIEADLAERPTRRATLIFVGDLIDRGPHSAQVVERLRTYRHSGLSTIFLLGNHEEVLLRILEGESTLIAKWRWFGGKECMESYGADAAEFGRLDERDALQQARDLVPKTHVDFLMSFADTCRFGDYLIVHAGIRPGIEFERQSQEDLRWIRGPFLEHQGDHGFVVVHGHTIVPEVVETENRIAIDTGAYRTGRLTALVIDGPERRYLTAVAPEPVAERPGQAGASIDSRGSGD